MKIRDPGHQYHLDVYDHKDDPTPSHCLTFMKREKEPFNTESHPGTNCQEVLRALIDRCRYLNSQKPCAETESIIGLLEAALLLFEVRAARRHDMINELKITSLLSLTSMQGCKVCGHIICRGH